VTYPIPALIVPPRPQLIVPPKPDRVGRPIFLTPREMLLFGPGPLRPSLPTVRQMVYARAGNAFPAFGAATLVGSTLIYHYVTRSGTTSATSPNEEAWTQLDPGGCQFPRDDNTNENPFGASGATVTVGRTTYTRALNRSNAVLWELTGVGLGGITVLTLSDQGSSTTHDLGSLGVLLTDRIALMTIGMGQDLNVTKTMVPSGVWAPDCMMSRDTDSSGSNVLNGQNFPYSWHGHMTGTGASARAQCDATSADRWGGICTLFA